MWSELFVDSLVRPRIAARRLLALELPGPVLLEAALLVTCLGMILGFVTIQLNPGALDAMTSLVLGNPLLGAGVQLGLLFFVTFLIVRVGRFFGGVGSSREALAVVVWLDAVMVCVQAAQVLALVLLPPLATLLALIAMFWVIWALASFVAELHGFPNTVLVFGGVVLTMTVVFFGMALVLALLGAPPQGIE